MGKNEEIEKMSNLISVRVQFDQEFLEARSWKSMFSENHTVQRDHPEVCGSRGHSCIFTGSLCFTSQLRIALHCWSFMYRVLGPLEWFGLTSRCLFSGSKGALLVYTVRIILLLVGLAFGDYKDFFIFLPPCLSFLRWSASFPNSLSG